MDYDESKPVPKGYRIVKRPHTTLAAIGGGLFVLGYLPSLYVAAIGSAAGEEGLEPLYIPLAGPFITIATEDASGAGIFWLMVLGLVQTGGAVMGVTGLVMPDTQLLYRNDVRVRILPIVTAGGGPGLGLTGTF
jgi:hypothetical protein